MGRIWICEGRIAGRPFIAGAGISLYSFEELCCYLYQNAESVEESFYNEMLCQWLAKETDMPRLAKELQDGIEKGRSGAWCLEKILTAGGLYSHKEVSQAVSLVQSMQSTGTAQRAKLRGDRFLKSGKYRKAWIEYQKALDEESDPSFQGRVWHNMGTMYARQFLYGAAGECYKRAYEIGQETKSSEAYLLALTCRDGQAKEQREGSLDRELLQLQELKESGNRTDYEKLLEDLLLRLKTEYRKSE